jgi:hypothetical protein
MVTHYMLSQALRLLERTSMIPLSTNCSSFLLCQQPSDVQVQGYSKYNQTQRLTQLSGQIPNNHESVNKPMESILPNKHVVSVKDCSVGKAHNASLFKRFLGYTVGLIRMTTACAPTTILSNNKDSRNARLPTQDQT